MSNTDVLHGDTDAPVCFSCGHPGPHRDGYDCVKAERDRLRSEADKWHQEWVYAHNRMDRLRDAAREVVIAYLAFHQPTMKAAIEKLVEALDA